MSSINGISGLLILIWQRREGSIEYDV